MSGISTPTRLIVSINRSALEQGHGRSMKSLALFIAQRVRRTESAGKRPELAEAKLELPLHNPAWSRTAIVGGYLSRYTVYDKLGRIWGPSYPFAQASCAIGIPDGSNRISGPT